MITGRGAAGKSGIPARPIPGDDASLFASTRHVTAALAGRAKPLEQSTRTRDGAPRMARENRDNDAPLLGYPAPSSCSKTIYEGFGDSNYYELGEKIDPTSFEAVTVRPE